MVGSGNSGARLRVWAIDARTDVMSATRGLETLRGFAAHLGPRAHAATPAEAAAAGDWILIAVPVSAVCRLPVDAPARKIVMDTSNYYQFRDGVIDELVTGGLTPRELFQQSVSRDW